jgi:hypothetical protein
MSQRPAKLFSSKILEFAGGACLARKILSPRVNWTGQIADLSQTAAEETSANCMGN